MDALHGTDFVALPATNAALVVDGDGRHVFPVPGFPVFPVGAVLFDIHRSDHFDAIPGGHIHAGKTVDAPVQIDLVFQIAQITALGFITGLLFVVSELHFFCLILETLLPIPN